MSNLNIYEIRDTLEKRNKFINDYKPFIANCVYSIINKRVEYGVDEELSIALIGFNHAIDRFDGRGSFLSFAKLVIKNKLYDYYRVNNKHLSNEPLFDIEDKENYKLVDKSFAMSKDKDDLSDLREEIVELNEMLKSYNITFSDLIKLSPKHKSKRKKVNSIVKFLVEDEEAYKYFVNTKNIPLKIIEDKFFESRKNIEPYRKYIITLLIILKSDFFYLKEYLDL